MVEKLKASVLETAEIKEGRILNGKPSKEELAEWIKTIGL